MRLFAASAAVLLAAPLSAQVIETPPGPAAYSLSAGSPMARQAAAVIDAIPVNSIDETQVYAAFESVTEAYQSETQPESKLAYRLALAALTISDAPLQRLAAAAGLDRNPSLTAALGQRRLVLANAAKHHTHLAFAMTSARMETEVAEADYPNVLRVRLPENTLDEAARLSRNKAAIAPTLPDVEAADALVWRVAHFRRAGSALGVRAAMDEALRQHLAKEWSRGGNVDTVRMTVHLDAVRRFANAVREKPRQFADMPYALSYLLEAAKRTAGTFDSAQAAPVREAALETRETIAAAIQGLFAVDSPLINPDARVSKEPASMKKPSSAIRQSADYALWVGGSGALFQLMLGWVRLLAGAAPAVAISIGIAVAAIGAYLLGSALKSGHVGWKTFASVISSGVWLAALIARPGPLTLAFLLLSAFSWVTNTKRLGSPQPEAKKPDPPKAPEERHARIDPEILAELEDALSSERRWQELEAAEAEAAEKEAAEKRRL
jgi:hypothetical protein